MAVPITGLYAGLLTLIVMYLGFQVGSTRGRTGISILYGGDMDLAEKARRHANFLENVPLALILMGTIELGGAPPLLLHGLGIALVVFRIAHPIGLRHDNIRHPLRAVGALGSILVLAISAGTALYQFVT